MADSSYQQSGEDNNLAAQERFRASSSSSTAEAIADDHSLRIVPDTRTGWTNAEPQPDDRIRFPPGQGHQITDNVHDNVYEQGWTLHELSRILGTAPAPGEAASTLQAIFNLLTQDWHSEGFPQVEVDASRDEDETITILQIIVQMINAPIPYRQADTRLRNIVNRLTLYAGIPPVDVEVHPPGDTDSEGLGEEMSWGGSDESVAGLGLGEEVNPEDVDPVVSYSERAAPGESVLEQGPPRYVSEPASDRAAQEDAQRTRSAPQMVPSDNEGDTNLGEGEAVPARPTVRSNTDEEFFIQSLPASSQIFSAPPPEQSNIFQGLIDQLVAHALLPSANRTGVVRFGDSVEGANEAWGTWSDSVEAIATERSNSLPVTWDDMQSDNFNHLPSGSEEVAVGESILDEAPPPYEPIASASNNTDGEPILMNPPLDERHLPQNRDRAASDPHPRGSDQPQGLVDALLLHLQADANVIKLTNAGRAMSDNGI